MNSSQMSRRRIHLPCTSCWCGGRVRVFDFVHYAAVHRTWVNKHVVRWLLGVSLAIAEPDHVAMAEHDVVCAGAALHGLVEIVAHGEVVGEELEIWSIPLLNVVEAHGGRAFTGRNCVG